MTKVFSNKSIGRRPLTTEAQIGSIPRGIYGGQCHWDGSVLVLVFSAVGIITPMLRTRT